MNPITRPCPHCGRDYDISHRLNGDWWCCPCGKWFRVVLRPRGHDEPAPGTAPAQETTADAALVAEMSALRSELEAAREDNAALLNVLEPFARFAGAQSIAGVGGEVADTLPDRYIVARAHSEDIDLTLGDLRRARAVQQAEHPGRTLMAELTKRMSELERERDAVRGILERLASACQNGGTIYWPQWDEAMKVLGRTHDFAGRPLEPVQ